MAIRGFENLHSRRRGAELREIGTLPHTDRVIEEMKKLLPKFSVLRAATLTFEKGFGTSAGANRNLWYARKINSCQFC